MYDIKVGSATTNFALMAWHGTGVIGYRDKNDLGTIIHVWTHNKKVQNYNNVVDAMQPQLRRERKSSPGTRLYVIAA